MSMIINARSAKNGKLETTTPSLYKNFKVPNHIPISKSPLTKIALREELRGRIEKSKARPIMENFKETKAKTKSK